MVQRCCVPQCGTKVGDRDINGTKVRFHRMPLTQERFSQWQDKITDSHRFRPVLSVNSRVCSKHFYKEDYIVKPLEYSTQQSSGIPLCKGAVPTRFKWSVDNCDISAPASSNESYLSISPIPPTKIWGENNFSNKTVVSNNQTSNQEDEEEVSGESDNRDSSNTNTFAETNTQDDTNTDASASSSNNIAALRVITTMGKKLSQETQCSLEDEKFKSEVHRKNTIIKQLLTKITDLEEEQKLMEEAIAELRAANQSFDNQIQELNRKNKKLEELYRKCARQHKTMEVKAPEPSSNTAGNKKNQFDHDECDDGGHEPQELQLSKGKRVKISSEDVGTSKDK